MVWKDNFLVDGNPKTLEGFLDEVFGLTLLRAREIGEKNTTIQNARSKPIGKCISAK